MHKFRLPVLVLLVAGWLLPHRPLQAADIPIDLQGGHIFSSFPAVVDLNDDGKLEIIAGGIDGLITIVDGATYEIAFQRNVSDYLPGNQTSSFFAGIAVADLDGNDQLEIVMATGWRPADRRYPGYLLVFTYVGGSEVLALAPGWPYAALDEIGNGSGPDGAPDSFVSTPALGDIDDDGDMEIVIGGMDRRLYAFHHDGSFVAGFPHHWDTLPINYRRDTLSSPALVDLDNDGALDIIIGTNNYPYPPPCPNPYYFYALRGDGSFLPGFPVMTTANIASSPAVGDINGDGSFDIVFGTGSYGESCGQPFDGKKVYAIDRFGQPLPGWPQATDGVMETSPALADLDGDGKVEVIAVCHDQNNRNCRRLYAWHGDGSMVNGFPVDFHEDTLIYQSPAVADVDGDNQLEILLSVGDEVAVVGPSGEVEELRFDNPGDAYKINPIIADVNGDGLLEMIIGGGPPGRGRIDIWNEIGSADGKVPWPMFHGDVTRQGFAATEPMDFDVKDQLYLPLIKRSRPQ
jgi:hypothetical protein